MLSLSQQRELVSQANLAPSVHNTQPARWSFAGDKIEILADPSTFLTIGDPSLRDAGLSCGAALEGTVIALKSMGFDVVKTEDRWSEAEFRNDLRVSSILTVNAGEVEKDPLVSFITERFTWRGKFEPVSGDVKTSLEAWGQDRSDVYLVDGESEIKYLAKVNDLASLDFFADRLYREELLSFMRLSKKHPKYSTDGLNREAMQMSKLEAFAAGPVLKYPMFEIMHKIKLGGALVSESAKTNSASGVVLFLADATASATEMGQIFYRRWLELTRLGLAAWPMAVIADNPNTNQEISERYGIKDKLLINAWRVGGLPDGAKLAPARVDVDDLIVTNIN